MTALAGLFSTRARWQSWLDVEAALAQAQAAVGMVPADAARAITEAAHVEMLDRRRIDAGFERTGHGLVPLVNELARVVGGEAAGWVHWGATSQNVMQTGDLLLLRQAHRGYEVSIREALLALADLAESKAETLMAARTHGQHAVPTTFGCKVAVWIDELLRHLERLEQVEGRVFVVLFGGAVGTFASMGLQGPAVQEGIARLLRMGTMQVPSRAIGDHLAEYVALLALVSATAGGMAHEVETLMGTEYGELEEPIGNGAVGSSTMPQKRNPHLCQDIRAAAADARAQVAPALEALDVRHESDRGANLTMITAYTRGALATDQALRGLVALLHGLQVFDERMRRNLDATGGLVMAEAVMMRLAVDLGRQEAHKVVHQAADRATSSGEPFAEVLSRDPWVATALADVELRSLFDPASYIGNSATIARDAARRARAAGVHRRECEKDAVT